MNDTIRWCWTHYRIPEDTDDNTDCGDRWREIGDCDIADALVIRADQPVYRIEWPKADVPEDKNWAHSVSEEVRYAIDNGVLVLLGGEEQ